MRRSSKCVICFVGKLFTARKCTKYSKVSWLKTEIKTFLEDFKHVRTRPSARQLYARAYAHLHILLCVQTYIPRPATRSRSVTYCLPKWFCGLEMKGNQSGEISMGIGNFFRFTPSVQTQRNSSDVHCDVSIISFLRKFSTVANVKSSLCERNSFWSKLPPRGIRRQLAAQMNRTRGRSYQTWIVIKWNKQREKVSSSLLEPSLSLFNSKFISYLKQPTPCVLCVLIRVFMSDPNLRALPKYFAWD